MRYRNGAEGGWFFEEVTEVKGVSADRGRGAGDKESTCTPGFVDLKGLETARPSGAVWEEGVQV